ncbi:hypothetical protein PQQ87_12315 [Paraburkholderia nemoris]|uniref:hypothetical protein n=1 Tax=Paraburkholderia nemoris TaxID=2793076 RepID=UPI0038B897C3
MTQGQADDAEDLKTDTVARLPSVQVVADRPIGYAVTPNKVPVICEILVTNDGETTLSDVGILLAAS